MRIGQGVDIHAFSEDPGRALVLGGVRIDGERGLAGHSDADVVTHALMDALLGAACLGDLGRHFPDDDPATAGVSSLELLDVVLDRVAAAGYVPCSADITVLAQSPRLASQLGVMAELLSHRLGTPVSVKATTTEQLGAIGRSEGIAAMAIVLVEER